MARHWITGAHGFIGRHLSCLLADHGHEVVGLGHGAWPDAEARAHGLTRWVSGDINADNLQALGAESGLPDVVFHLAGGSSVRTALANPGEDFFRTVTTTKELFEWLRRSAPLARVVTISSAAVYGAGHDGPMPETTPLRPCSPYGHHKAMMEALCRSYADAFGLQVVIARLFSVYGSGLRKQLLWDLCTKLEGNNHPLQLGGTGEEIRDWTEVRDVVRALATISNLAAPEVPILNVGTGIGTSVRHIANSMLLAWDESPEERDVIFNGQGREGDPFSLQADAKALGRIGFEWRIPLAQGLDDYVRWFKSQSHSKT